jgi:hypothetical protein
MKIIKDLDRTKKIIAKQISFLSSTASKNHFQKWNYSFGIGQSANFYVCFKTEEQACGSCYSDAPLPAPETFSVKVRHVTKSIRIVLDTMLEQTSKFDINQLVALIFRNLHVKEYTEYDYYGNYRRYKSYSIPIDQIYKILDGHS